MFKQVFYKNYITYICGLLFLICGFSIILSYFFDKNTNITAYFLHVQDRWLLLCLFLCVVLACLGLGERRAPLDLSPRVLAALGLVAASLVYIGHRWVLCGYDLSRDEVLADFDATILASGHLVQPLPLFWQGHADALNMLYMLPVVRPVAWVSLYLPMNAALRAMVGLIVDASLTGPLLVLVGAFALWKCARLLWPGDREAACVAVILYLTSGQVLVAGMTAYAMPAHLTLNLVWLWLFLTNRRAADLGAIGVGAVATGLHEPIFHPLFAIPFLCLLLRERAWRRVGMYGVGYAAIAILWYAEPLYIRSLVAGPLTQDGPGGVDAVSRLLTALFHGYPFPLQDMAANLLRFAAWQAPMAIPLLVLGFVPALRGRPVKTALALGIVLTLYAMMLIQTYQGHGFGYRYLQGVIGSAILVSVEGWRRIAGKLPGIRSLFLRTSVAGAFVVLPIQFWMGHALYAPYAQIYHRLSRDRADYVMIDPQVAPFIADVVRNEPDLSNRPIFLQALPVDAGLVAEICRQGAVVTLPEADMFAAANRYFSTLPPGDSAERRSGVARRLVDAGCSVGREHTWR